MTLFDAAYELEELARGQPPGRARIQRGLRALAPLLKQSNCDPRLHDAAFLLETLLVQGTSLDRSAGGLVRAGELASVVRSATFYG